MAKNDESKTGVGHVDSIPLLDKLEECVESLFVGMRATDGLRCEQMNDEELHCVFSEAMALIAGIRKSNKGNGFLTTKAQRTLSKHEKEKAG